MLCPLYYLLEYLSIQEEDMFFCTFYIAKY